MSTRVRAADGMVYRSGDLIDVEINCKQNQLTVRNTTKSRVESIVLPAGRKWRLYVVQCGHGSVRIKESKLL